ncbi:hypothetical protein INT44_002875 [Umbelopsis vinacea]|uniref:Reverse transcriptase domain-containing protein n=1 Tax=Umbelopsis vinacea TaxID=44442 RepID=A0A8H7UI19_9FUNG|nr:hypothetical protein INT44_002875 [Umbelopsis vinacea]
MHEQISKGQLQRHINSEHVYTTLILDAKRPPNVCSGTDSPLQTHELQIIREAIGAMGWSTPNIVQFLRTKQFWRSPTVIAQAIIRIQTTQEQGVSVPIVTTAQQTAHNSTSSQSPSHPDYESIKPKKSDKHYGKMLRNLSAFLPTPSPHYFIVERMMVRNTAGETSKSTNMSNSPDILMASVSSTSNVQTTNQSTSDDIVVTSDSHTPAAEPSANNDIAMTVNPDNHTAERSTPDDIVMTTTDNRQDNEQPSTTTTTESEIQPWRPVHPGTYPSITQLIAQRSSRRILRTPLFANTESRKSFELAVKELVETHMPDPDDDDEEILTYKNNQFHDELYALIADFTRRRDFPDLEHLDSEEDLNAALARANLSPYDRRRLLRQRHRLREGRESTRLFHQYRHRAKMTFDQIMSEQQQSPCPIPKETVEESFTERYRRPTHPTPVIRSVQHRFRSTTIHEIGEYDVTAALRHFNKSSSPGFDGIPYKVWSLFPCLGQWLLVMFQSCYGLGWTPDHWRISKTILLHKKDDTNVLSNWRPISLQNTAGKIYAGFVKHTPGCIEHDYYAQATIRKARRQRLPLYICSYDIGDAFGSISHERIQQSLELIGLDDRAIDIILSMYTDLKGWVDTPNGPTGMIPIERGTKQGDPLSPMIFNICLLDLSLSLNDMRSPAESNQHNHLMFADDIIIMSNNAQQFRRLHNHVTEYMNSHRTQLNPTKCCFSATLPSGHTKRKQDSNVRLRINQEYVRQVPLTDSWTYLGSATGLQRRTTYHQFRDIHDTFKRQLHKITNSKLRIFQKIHAIKTFLLSQIEYYMRLHGVGISQAQRLGSTLREGVRKFIGLPRNTITKLLHSRVEDGGFGFFDPWDWHCSTLCSHDHSRRTTDDYIDTILTHTRTRDSTQYGADDLYPSAYRFAVKARLNLHPTNANKQRWGQEPDDRCRRCGDREDIHHVLSYCPAYMQGKSRRHDTVLKRIASSVRYNNRNNQVFINQSPPHIIANGLPPDLVVIHEKEVIMLDVVVTSQHQPDALNIA